MALKRILTIGLAMMLTGVFCVPSGAQNDPEAYLRKDYNEQVRTNTWSIYAEGGTSWASGVWYQNLNAKQSYALSPLAGGGVDYNIRPWVRIGVEYLWSNYRREQQFTSLDMSVMPVKAYGNYKMNYHKMKLGAGFNLMEIGGSDRNAQWLNIYAGTGIGYLIASGTEYGIWLSTTKTENGVTTPLNGNVSISNESTISINSSVKAVNDHSSFDGFYVPASLQIEADLGRQFTIGLKGEYDYLVGREDIAPQSLIYAMVTLRYNIVPGNAKKLIEYYKSK